MGWSFYNDPMFGREYIINKMTSAQRLSPGYKMLEYRVVGNNIWYLYQAPEGRKTIGLTLIKSGGRRYGWGYKGISEGMGPNEVNCPLSLLNKASRLRCSDAPTQKPAQRAFFHLLIRDARKPVGPPFSITHP